MLKATLFFHFVVFVCFVHCWHLNNFIKHFLSFFFLDFVSYSNPLTILSTATTRLISPSSSMSNRIQTDTTYFSLYVFLLGSVVVKGRVRESGLSRRDEGEREREGKKIWFRNNALVCMSLLELLLDIKKKMFKSADLSTSHWSKVDFRFRI